jgi:hypothetical protein
VKRFWVVGLGLFGAAMACGAQKPVPLMTYTDTAHGVSFQYPTAWKPMVDASYFGWNFKPDVAKRMASFTFSPKGNLYEKTVLLELVFNYFVMPSASLDECVAKAKEGANADGAPKKVQIHGVPFVEVSGVGVGMCHSQTSQMDVAWRGGQCLVFERDFDTECFGADDSKRRLTTPEEKALQRHLDEALQSVRLR